MPRLSDPRRRFRRLRQATLTLSFLLVLASTGRAKAETVEHEDPSDETPLQAPDEARDETGDVGLGSTDEAYNLDPDAMSEASPQAEPPAKETQRRRWRFLPRHTEQRLVVGKLRYVPPMDFDSSFVTTHVRFQQGIARMEVPNYRLPDREDAFDLDLIGAIERLDVGIAILPRVGVFGRVEGYAVLGTNTDTALLLGARGRARWESGVHLELFRRSDPGTVISLRLKAMGRFGQSVQPILLVDSLLDEPEATFDDVLSGRFVDRMLSTDAGRSGGLSLNAAQTLHRHVGLQGTLAVNAGTASLDFFDGSEPVRAPLRVVRLISGASLLANAQPVLPLAMQLEYRHTTIIQDAARERRFDRTDHNHHGGFGLYAISGVATAVGISGTMLLDRNQQPAEQRFWSAKLMLQLQF